MPDHEVRLESLLSQLAGGHIGISDAAKAVRRLTFPVEPRRTLSQRQEDAGLPEADPPLPGSFFMISQAYTSGRITRRQYEALQQAAADAIRARAAQGRNNEQDDQETAQGGLQHDEAPVRPAPGGQAGGTAPGSPGGPEGK